MKTLCLMLLCAVYLQEYINADESNCLIHFEDNGACACYSESELGAVSCHADRQSIEIQPCYCIYYDEGSNSTLVGFCLYSCLEPAYTRIEITSSTEFNANVCNAFGPLHRVGLFCGQCNESYGLAAYSYWLLSCVPCEEYGYKNWLKYFAVALLPLTVFYILAVLFSFQVTSSSLNGIVLVVQCITSQLQMVIIQENPNTKQYAVPIKIASSIFGVLNLDFFRMVYSPFCLHPKANIPEILLLNYIAAIYPFFLIFITYLLVNAYDRQLVHLIWKPFKMCAKKYHKTWNTRTSLIQIIATFILLSYNKIIETSCGIFFITLSSSKVYEANGQFSYIRFSALYDGATPYLGYRHLPFAIPGVCFSFLSFLPLLLLSLYPCGCFQRCLNCCGGRCQPLHVFADAFQGCYRTHPRDLRYFSALYLFLRVLLLIQVSVFPSVLMFFTSGMVSLAGAAIIAAFQPYKSKTHNTIDTVLLLLMGMYFLSYYANTVGSSLIAAIVQGASIVLIVMYCFLLLAWKLGILLKITKVWKHLRSHQQGHSADEVLEPFDRDFEDSLDASGTDYQPLLESNSQKPTY